MYRERFNSNFNLLLLSCISTIRFTFTTSPTPQLLIILNSHNFSTTDTHSKLISRTATWQNSQNKPEKKTPTRNLQLSCEVLKLFTFSPFARVIKSIIFIFDHVLSQFFFALTQMLAYQLCMCHFGSNKSLVCSTGNLKFVWVWELFYRKSFLCTILSASKNNFCSIFLAFFIVVFRAGFIRGWLSYKFYFRGNKRIFKSDVDEIRKTDFHSKSLFHSRLLSTMIN